MSLVLAFAGNRKPVIFEELRKEHFMASYKHAVGQTISSVIPIEVIPIVVQHMQ